MIRPLIGSRMDERLFGAVCCRYFLSFETVFNIHNHISPGLVSLNTWEDLETCGCMCGKCKKGENIYDDIV